MALFRGQKFRSFTRNYERNLDGMSNSSQSTRPTGRRVLWEELLEEVILHITPLCSLLHMLLKDKCKWMSENCKSLILQDKYNIEIYLYPAIDMA